MMDSRNMRGIENSRIFMVVGTQNYFDDIPMEMVRYAKSLNKPFRVFVDQGVTVPEHFREGVDDYKEMVVDLKSFNPDKVGKKDMKEYEEFFKVEG